MSFLNLDFSAGPMNRTEEMALYMVHSLGSRLGIQQALNEPTLPYNLRKDCELMVGRVCEAYNNPIKLPWSIEEYAAQMTPQQNIGIDEKELELLKQFPPLYSREGGQALPLVDRPCTVVDSQGIIVLWYMPGALSELCRMDLVKHLPSLDIMFQHSLPSKSTINPSAPKWRDRGYKPPRTTQISPGHLSFSPCWYNLGGQLSISMSLRGWPKSPTVLYLRKTKDSLSLLGAVLAVIHPQLAVHAFSILRGIQNGAIINDATNRLGPERTLWPAPFTAFSILSNRATQLHRDGKGVAPFYDIVTTLGSYTNGRFNVPGIGLQFKYNAGTMIGICGKVLAHEVDHVEGDRFCLVQYFHKKALQVIQESLQTGLDFNQWMKQEDFLANVQHL